MAEPEGLGAEATGIAAEFVGLAASIVAEAAGLVAGLVVEAAGLAVETIGLVAALAVLVELATRWSCNGSSSLGGAGWSSCGYYGGCGLFCDGSCFRWKRPIG